MPTVTEMPVKGYAHCRNPRCAGSKQQAVDAIRIEDSYTFVERGGDLPGIETSQIRHVFANEDDRPCPVCSLPREVTDQARPSYENLSGFAQDGLLDIELNDDGTRFDPAKQAALQAEASDKLSAENAELRERLARLEGFLMAKQEGASE